MIMTHGFRQRLPANLPGAKENAARELRASSKAQGRAKTRLTHMYPDVYRTLYLEEMAKIKQRAEIDTDEDE